LPLSFEEIERRYRLRDQIDHLKWGFAQFDYNFKLNGAYIVSFDWDSFDQSTIDVTLEDNSKRKLSYDEIMNIEFVSVKETAMESINGVSAR
jgi:hypothetical protein